MQSSSTMPSRQWHLPRLARQQWLVVGAASLVIVAIAWYLFRPELLFVNKTVNERLPAAAAAPTTASLDQNSLELRSGMFHKVAKETKGAATIYQAADGKQVLRLTGLETANGPDLHVYLVAARDALDNDTVKQADHVDLGSLKGNIGDQNYDIPAGTDVSKYQAVVIWCKRFNVNFGAAPLAMAGQSSSMGHELRALAAGSFHKVAKDTKGSAAIYQAADGKQVLRLTGLETANGPDLHVYLVAARDALDNDTVKQADHVELGSLKGNIGDQNYDIPAGTDLSKYQAVTIWCKRFSVNFGTAPLVMK